MNTGIDAVIAAADQAAAEVNGDYIKDGLRYCGKCDTQKQAVVSISGVNRIVGCMCHCECDKYEKEKKREADQQRAMYINSLRVNGLKDLGNRDMRFENDDGKSSDVMDKARRYVTSWDKMYRTNAGLILWGNTGNGKTFTASCIANALIDTGVPVMMTSFPRILSALNGMFNEDKLSYIEGLNNFKLLVIDDLGAERQSEYALEQVYNVIDTRYKSKKPLIITTNLTLGEMQKAKNMDYQRIYDRVLEMCIPIFYNGESRRKDIAADKRNAVREIFGT